MVRSDGKKLMTSVVPLKRYNILEAPKEITPRTFEGGPVEAVLSHAVGLQSIVLMKFLFEDDAKKSLLKLSEGIAVSAPDVKLEGKTYKAIVLPLDGPDFKLLIDPATHLVERVDTMFSAADLKELPLGSKAKRVTIYWSAASIRSTRRMIRPSRSSRPRGMRKSPLSRISCPPSKKTSWAPSSRTSSSASPRPILRSPCSTGPAKRRSSRRRISPARW